MWWSIRCTLSSAVGAVQIPNLEKLRQVPWDLLSQFVAFLGWLRVVKALGPDQWRWVWSEHSMVWALRNLRSGSLCRKSSGLKKPSESITAYATSFRQAARSTNQRHSKVGDSRNKCEKNTQIPGQLSDLEIKLKIILERTEAVTSLSKFLEPFFLQSLLPAFPFLEADIKEKIVAAALEAALHIDSRSTELHDIDITWYMCCVRYVSLAVAWHEQLKETCDLKTCSTGRDFNFWFWFAWRQWSCSCCTRIGHRHH